DGVLEDAQQLQLLVATERYREAEKVAARLMDRAGRLATSLSRDARLADNVFRGCLYRVQGALQRRDRDEAPARGIECRRLATHIPVADTMFPPSVVGLIAEVDAELQLLAQDLTIQSRPSGCSAFLNGRLIDATPVTIRRLVPGDYAVRVECNGYSKTRVHRVSVAGESRIVRIDARYDDAVRTEGRLLLQYKDEKELDGHRFDDALRLGETLEVTDIVLLAEM